MGWGPDQTKSRRTQLSDLASDSLVAMIGPRPRRRDRVIKGNRQRREAFAEAICTCAIAGDLRNRGRRASFVRRGVKPVEIIDKSSCFGACARSSVAARKHLDKLADLAALLSFIAGCDRVIDAMGDVVGKSPLRLVAARHARQRAEL